jgi:hypothetical protein
MERRILFLAFRGLEGGLVAMTRIPFFKQKEKGQSAAVFAVVVTALVIFVVGIMDYMITTSRTMEAYGIADLSAHAGAQEVNVLPNGIIQIASNGPAVSAAYYHMQSKSYLQLVNTSCGRVHGEPACEVIVRVHSAGYLIPQHWITVHAVGYMAYGSTRGDQ